MSENWGQHRAASCACLPSVFKHSSLLTATHSDPFQCWAQGLYRFLTGWECFQILNGLYQAWKHISYIYIYDKLPKGVQIEGESFNSQPNLIQLCCAGVTILESAQREPKRQWRVETPSTVVPICSYFSICMKRWVKLLKMGNLTLSDFFCEYARAQHVCKTKSGLRLSGSADSTAIFKIMILFLNCDFFEFLKGQ